MHDLYQCYEKNKIKNIQSLFDYSTNFLYILIHLHNSILHIHAASFYAADRSIYLHLSTEVGLLMVHHFRNLL